MTINAQVAGAASELSVSLVSVYLAGVLVSCTHRWSSLSALDAGLLYITTNIPRHVIPFFNRKPIKNQ